MTDAPINLNRARKDRARAADKAQADENSVRHGRTKAQKDAERLDTARAARHLDDAKRDT